MSATRVRIDFEGGSVELPEGETFVGRAAGCRLRFARPEISRRHVCLHVSDGAVSIEDLSSTNGTRVNGELLANDTVTLDDDDLIEIGALKLRVSLQDDDEFNEETPTHESFRAVAMPVPDDWATRPTRNYGAVDARSPSGRERRLFARHAVSIAVRYESDTLSFEGLARDLGLGGMFIASELLDAPGTPCTVTVLGESGPARPIKSAVAHVVTQPSAEQPAGFGLRFVEPDERLLGWVRAALITRSVTAAAPLH